MAIQVLALVLFSTFSIGALAREERGGTAGSVVARPVQQSAFYQFAVGDARVVVLSDGTVPQDLHALLKGASPSEIDAVLAALVYEESH